jgi:hypothetical protein
MPQNPYAGTASEHGWQMGFAYGFTGPEVTDPPPPIAPELIDAFNEGRLAGQQTAIEGFPVSSECVDIKADVPEGGKGIVLDGIDSLEVIDIVKDVLKTHIADAVGGAVVLIGELLITSVHHDQEPEDVVAVLGAGLKQLLSELGIEDSFEVFCGLGIDVDAEGCQIRLSPVFKSFEQARDAAVAMDRPECAVARWRSDVPGAVDLIGKDG